MKILQLLAVTAFLFINVQISFGQKTTVCSGHPEESITVIDTTPKSVDGEVCFDKCENYFGKKLIKVYFHVIQDSAGMRNFNSTHIDWFSSLISTANERLDANHQPGNFTSGESNFNFTWDENDIIFDPRVDWCNPANTIRLPNTDVEGYLNVVMIESCANWANTPCVGDCPGGWSNHSGVDWLYIHRSYFRHLEGYDCDNGEIVHRANVLIHEAGHAFTLRHVFEPDLCSDTASGDGDNWMSNGPCKNDFFTCCQLDRMHSWLESDPVADYVIELESEVCQASFELAKVEAWCNVYLENTSTSPTGSFTSEWCVTNLSTNETDNFLTEHLEYNGELGVEYEVCLCIEDESGCSTWACEVMKFEPKVQAKLVDKNGFEKETFCFGEDVYINTDGSQFYDQYFMSIWKLTTPTAYARFANPKWESGDVPSPFNVSAYNWYPSADWAFCPGDYKVQFALRNSCDTWEMVELEFTVKCCENTFDASFNISVDEVNGMDVVTPKDYDRYDEFPNDCAVSHSWCIYVVEEDGTITLLQSLDSPSFSLPIEEEVQYRIVHRVNTPCGEYCAAFEICKGCKKEGELSMHKALCPDDCSISECEVPAGFSCDRKSTGVEISWNAVTNAKDYIVEITPNDPACCSGGLGQAPITFMTKNLSSLQTHFCFSWRVKTRCIDGSMSEWSDLQCLTPTTVCDINDSKKSLKQPREIQKMDFLVSPNPFNDILTIDNAFETKNVRATIYNQVGQLVKSISIDERQTAIDLSLLENGLYIIYFMTPDGESKTEKIIKID